jgi:transposase InsO family protein
MTELDLLNSLMKRPNRKAKLLYNHFDITEPNHMHQIDLLFLPANKGFPYCFCVVDCASRYKAARPVRNKTTETIKKTLEDIYRTDEHLAIPDKINADKGGEFNSKLFKEFCAKNNIELIFNEPSNHLSFVESFNRTLTIEIFKHQHLEELRTGKLSKSWVDMIPTLVIDLNHRYNSMIEMTPNDAIQLKHVDQPENNFSILDIKKKIPNGTPVRRLLNNDEVLNVLTKKISVERHRVTDPNWSFVIYEVTGYIQKPDCLTLHQITDLQTNKVYPHYFTYYQLQKVKGSNFGY